MAYTTINKSTDYFNTKLWSGNGNDNTSITGVGFQPDLSWVKARDKVENGLFTDAVRGGNKQIYSNLSSAETSDGNKLKSFNADGFTIGTSDVVNNSISNYVAWNWLGANGTAANTDGDIASTVSANTTSGFSIVSYTGNATAGATIGHGLGSVPKFAIFKRRNSSGNWQVYHHSIGNTDVLKLNGTDAKLDDNTFLNDTSPSSSLITLGGGGLVNGNGDTHICYAFAEKQGYSKFGSYTGNGNADGTFVYTGFKPAFVLAKKTNEQYTSWIMLDNKRLTSFNPIEVRMFANLSSAEDDINTSYCDLVSNGFKIRKDDNNINDANDTYIYMAFAAAPLVGTNNVAANAR